MEWYELLIVIPLFWVAISIAGYYSRWGGEYSDYEVDKHNEEINKINRKIEDAKKVALKKLVINAF